MSEALAGFLLVLAGATCIGVQWMFLKYASRQDDDHWLNRPILLTPAEPQPFPVGRTEEQAVVEAARRLIGLLWGYQCPDCSPPDEPCALHASASDLYVALAALDRSSQPTTEDAR